MGDWKPNVSFEDKKEVLDEFVFMEQCHLGIDNDDVDELLEIRDLSDAARKIIYDYDKDVLVLDWEVAENSYEESCKLIMREMRHQYQWKVVKCGSDWENFDRELDFVVKARQWKEEHIYYKKLSEYDAYPEYIIYLEDNSKYEMEIVKDAREYVEERLRKFGWDKEEED